MIGWLTGIVRTRDPMTGEIIVEAGGVGYQLVVSWQTFAVVPEIGQRAELWVHTHVREDILALFGFATVVEKRMFRLLTSVPQVGPRNAIAVLGGFPIDELLQAIACKQRETLERIPGVGKRTAERILLDLEDKVVPLLEALGQGATGTQAPSPPGDSSLREEAQAVLTNLGWKIKPVEKAVETALAVDSPPDTLDALVRNALASLMGR
jgi:holliday junction DNA helicase RuvA